MAAHLVDGQASLLEFGGLGSQGEFRQPDPDFASRLGQVIQQGGNALHLGVVIREAHHLGGDHFQVLAQFPETLPGLAGAFLHVSAQSRIQEPVGLIVQTLMQDAEFSKHRADARAKGLGGERQFRLEQLIQFLQLFAATGQEEGFLVISSGQKGAQAVRAASRGAGERPHEDGSQGEGKKKLEDQGPGDAEGRDQAAQDESHENPGEDYDQIASQPGQKTCQRFFTSHPVKSVSQCARLSRDRVMRTILITTMGWTLAFAGIAGEAEAPAAAPAGEPLVEQAGENRYRIGLVELHAVTREIRFPAVVNLEEGPLEYILVKDAGKVHESLLRTDVSPAHLQVGLKLLRYRAGWGRLFDHLWPPGEAPLREAAGEEVEILVSWAGMPEIPLRKAILDRGTGKPMDETPWVFTGSDVIDGQFQAEVEGSIVAIYRDGLAMINTPHPQSLDDENWCPVAKVLPARETKVEVVIRPWKPQS